MYQKLEDRLKLYEHNHPIKDDDGLIAAIESILNEQDSLPIEKRDFDLIAEATDSILKLQGYRESDRATMAEEAANSVKARIALQKGITSNGKPQNKHRSVLRWIIPLVAVLAMTTVAVCASPSSRLAISEMTNRIFSSIKPKTVLYEDSTELIISDDITYYSSFNELSSAFDHSLLLPIDIEKDLQNLIIESSDYGLSQEIIITFDYINSPCIITISNYDKLPSESIEYNAKIGEYEVILCESNTYFTSEWIHKQKCYQVKAQNFDILEAIINYMR
jgi:hypothetical protein